MKSPHCRTRWHSHCVDPLCDCEHHRENIAEMALAAANKVFPDDYFQQQPDEGGLKSTSVGSIPTPEGTQVRDYDHKPSSFKSMPSLIPDMQAIDDPEPPPPYPAIVNRGKFRIAEEPSGTDLTAPWILDWCVMCREPTWTHNHVIAARNETLCEDCAWRLVDEYAETRVAAENRRRTMWHDPFA